MSWSLSARADVREIGGALRLEYDRLVHLSGGEILGDAQHVAINAALAAVNQVATSGALGTSGVGVVISGHTPLDGRPEGATVSMVLSGYLLEPPAIGPVEGRPDSRFRHDPEDAVSTTNPFGPGVESTEPRGQTDSDAFLAAQGEAERIERDRNDDEQQRARREVELKNQRDAAEKGTVAGADVVIGPERRPNDPVTQAQEQRDRDLVTATDPDAFTANPNETFLDQHGAVQTSANPDASGELVPGPDGEPEAIRSEDLLAQPPAGAEGTPADPTFIQPAEPEPAAPVSPEVQPASPDAVDPTSADANSADASGDVPEVAVLDDPPPAPKNGKPKNGG